MVPSFQTVVVPMADGMDLSYSVIIVYIGTCLAYFKVCVCVIETRRYDNNNSCMVVLSTFQPLSTF